MTLIRKTTLFLLFVLLLVCTIPVLSRGIYTSQGLPVRRATVGSIYSPGREQRERDSNTLRIMTFNIRHGKGMDNRCDLDRIARVIREADADLVALNEVDVKMPRSGFMDQARYLAAQVGMNSYFVPSFRFLFSQFGNGLLSDNPMMEVEREEIPRFKEREPRGLGRVTIMLDERPVHVIVTHLGLNPVEREEQLAYLADRIVELTEPVILLGDFNTTPTSLPMQNFLLVTGLEVHSYEPTYPSDDPGLKLDYILASKEWEVVEEVVPIVTLASDHFPVVGTFRLK